MKRLMIIAVACLIGGTAANAEKQCGENQFPRGNKCYNSLGDIPGRTRVESVEGGGFGQKGHEVTCTGILIPVDMVPHADFPMAVIYENGDGSSNSHTCVLDLGHAGHWPLRGDCWEGEKCVLTGSYFKKIGNTYYMRDWYEAKAPDHAQ
jgi:hypothetical protein